MEIGGSFSRRRYIKSLSFVMIGLFLSQASEFVKDFVMARRYGATSTTDAFLAAYSIPFIIYSVLIVASPMILVPVLSEHKSEGKHEEASIIFSNIVWSLSGLLIVFAIIINLSPKNILAMVSPGLASDAMEVAVNNIRRLSWAMIPFGGIVSMASLLRSYDFYFIPSALKFSGNLCFVILILILAVKNSSLLAASYSLFLAQFVFLCFFLNRTEIRLKWPANLLGKRNIQLFSLFTIPIITVLSSQAVIIIERIFSSMLDPGNLSITAYASRIYTGVVNLIGGTIFGASLPVLSNIAAKGKMDDAKKLIITNLRLVILVALPSTVLIVTVSGPIFELLFYGSALELKQVAQMSWVIALYGLGLFFSVTVPLGTSIFSAFSLQKMLLINGSLFLLTNIAVNSLFIFKIGIYSLPLARFFGNLFVIVVTYYVVSRKFFKIIDRTFIYFFCKVLLSSTAMYTVLFIFTTWLGRLTLNLGPFYRLTILFLIILFAITIYFLACYILRVNELRIVRRAFEKRF